MFGEPMGHLTDDIIIELGLMLEHSEECYKTFGRLACECHVGQAQRIVRGFADDPRNGAVTEGDDQPKGDE